MLGPLIVCYLFLGGTGAGACLVLAVLGMLAPRELVAVQGAGGRGASRGPAGAHAVLRPPAPYRRLLAPGYAAALVALALGMVCLLADVGRADRLLLLLTSPALSHVAVGAWSLAVCAALALAALAVMLYTGLLLQSLNAVPLWATPWLPALFVLSSLSCGMALVLAAAQLTGAAFAFVTVLGRLAAVDAAVVVLEALVLAAFVGTALAGIGGDFLVDRTDEALAASAEALVAGEAAWLFWGGFVLAGLAVPFALDVALARLRRPRPALALVAAACVLAGGLAMRFCVVEAGMHPLLAMAS